MIPSRDPLERDLEKALVFGVADDTEIQTAFNKVLSTFKIPPIEVPLREKKAPQPVPISEKIDKTIEKFAEQKKSAREISEFQHNFLITSSLIRSKDGIFLDPLAFFNTLFAEERSFEDPKTEAGDYIDSIEKGKTLVESIDLLGGVSTPLFLFVKFFYLHMFIPAFSSSNGETSDDRFKTCIGILTYFYEKLAAFQKKDQTYVGSKFLNRTPGQFDILSMSFLLHTLIAPHLFSEDLEKVPTKTKEHFKAFGKYLSGIIPQAFTAFKRNSLEESLEIPNALSLLLFLISTKNVISFIPQKIIDSSGREVSVYEKDGSFLAGAMTNLFRSPQNFNEDSYKTFKGKFQSLIAFRNMTGEPRVPINLLTQFGESLNYFDPATNYTPSIAKLPLQGNYSNLLLNSKISEALSPRTVANKEEMANLFLYFNKERPSFIPNLKKLPLSFQLIYFLGALLNRLCASLKHDYEALLVDFTAEDGQEKVEELYKLATEIQEIFLPKLTEFGKAFALYAKNREALEKKVLDLALESKISPVLIKENLPEFLKGKKLEIFSKPASKQERAEQTQKIEGFEKQVKAVAAFAREVIDDDTLTKLFKETSSKVFQATKVFDRFYDKKTGEMSLVEVLSAFGAPKTVDTILTCLKGLQSVLKVYSKNPEELFMERFFENLTVTPLSLENSLKKALDIDSSKKDKDVQSFLAGVKVDSLTPERVNKVLSFTEFIAEAYNKNSTRLLVLQEHGKAKEQLITRDWVQRFAKYVEQEAKKLLEEESTEEAIKKNASANVILSYIGDGVVDPFEFKNFVDQTEGEVKNDYFTFIDKLENYVFDRDVEDMQEKVKSLTDKEVLAQTPWFFATKKLSPKELEKYFSPSKQEYINLLKSIEYVPEKSKASTYAAKDKQNVLEGFFLELIAMQKYVELMRGGYKVGAKTLTFTELKKREDFQKILKEETDYFPGLYPKLVQLINEISWNVEDLSFLERIFQEMNKASLSEGRIGIDFTVKAIEGFLAEKISFVRSSLARKVVDKVMGQTGALSANALTDLEKIQETFSAFTSRSRENITSLLPVLGAFFLWDRGLLSIKSVGVAAAVSAGVKVGFKLKNYFLPGEGTKEKAYTDYLKERNKEHQGQRYTQGTFSYLSSFFEKSPDALDKEAYFSRVEELRKSFLIIESNREKFEATLVNMFSFWEQALKEKLKILERSSPFHKPVEFFEFQKALSFLTQFIHSPESAIKNLSSFLDLAPIEAFQKIENRYVSSDEELRHKEKAINANILFLPFIIYERLTEGSRVLEKDALSRKNTFFLEENRRIVDSISSSFGLDAKKLKDLDPQIFSEFLKNTFQETLRTVFLGDAELNLNSFFFQRPFYSLDDFLMVKRPRSPGVMDPILRPIKNYVINPMTRAFIGNEKVYDPLPRLSPKDSEVTKQWVISSFNTLRVLNALKLKDSKLGQSDVINSVKEIFSMFLTATLSSPVGISPSEKNAFLKLLVSKNLGEEEENIWDHLADFLSVNEAEVFNEKEESALIIDSATFSFINTLFTDPKQKEKISALFNLMGNFLFFQGGSEIFLKSDQIEKRINALDEEEKRSLFKTLPSVLALLEKTDTIKNANIETLEKERILEEGQKARDLEDAANDVTLNFEREKVARDQFRKNQVKIEKLLRLYQKQAEEQKTTFEQLSGAMEKHKAETARARQNLLGQKDRFLKEGNPEKATQVDSELKNIENQNAEKSRKIGIDLLQAKNSYEETRNKLQGIEKEQVNLSKVYENQKVPFQERQPSQEEKKEGGTSQLSKLNLSEKEQEIPERLPGSSMMYFPLGRGESEQKPPLKDPIPASKEGEIVYAFSDGGSGRERVGGRSSNVLAREVDPNYANQKLPLQGESPESLKEQFSRTWKDRAEQAKEYLPFKNQGRVLAEDQPSRPLEESSIGRIGEEIDPEEVPLREPSETDSLESMSEMGGEFGEGYQLLGSEESMLPGREKAVSFLTNIKKVPPKYAIGAGAALGAAGLGYLAYQAFSPKEEEKKEDHSPEKPEDTPTQNPKQNAPNPFKYHSEYVNMPQRYKRLSRRGTTG